MWKYISYKRGETMDNLRHILQTIGQGVSREKFARAFEDFFRLADCDKRVELTVHNVTNNNPLQPMHLLEKVSWGQNCKSKYFGERFPSVWTLRNVCSYFVVCDSYHVSCSRLLSSKFLSYFFRKKNFCLSKYSYTFIRK